MIEPNLDIETNGLAICMYHYIYDDNTLPTKLNSNYISLDTLNEEIEYLTKNDYYFPTWSEVRDYIGANRFCLKRVLF